MPGANPRNPQTPQSIIDLLRGSNPWVKDADFDHHGYGVVEASAVGPAVHVQPGGGRQDPQPGEAAGCAVRLPARRGQKSIL